MAALMTTTWNGALSLKTTKSARVDFFAGVLRGTPEMRLKSLMAASYAEDPLHTLKIVAYLRDIRGGKGERLAGRLALRWLAECAPEALTHNLHLYVSEYGRYDDLLALMGTQLEITALTVFSDQLRADLAAIDDEAGTVSLCAKWVPSENKAADKQNHVTAKLARRMGLSRAELRKKYLSPLRARLQLLERFMCAKEWEAIDLNKVPSVAMHRYGQKEHVFARHLGEAFAAWKAGLKTGETKVNATVLFPHQVVERYYNKGGDVDPLVEAQWSALVQEGRKLGVLSRTLVMSDVSGSMTGLPMLISIALGLFISELAQDEYKDLVMTFETKPQFHHVRGTSLQERVANLASAPWGGSTNLLAALRLILNLACRKAITGDKMPERIIIVSDMQFNEADGRFRTNYELAHDMFKRAGYEIPHVVFWNVNGAVTDFPTLGSQAKVSLVSGYSHSIMKATLNGTSITPFDTMLEAINDERYDRIQLPPAVPDAPLAPLST
ncbi:hypothetical protein ACHHYP_05921 [Achlya hypogyna]|uniref:TROVE domain-containing protein n=1 Tax=Achlya hypogyna TaxID=1202772 RepID=A0A1V9YW08_ACHHY|nr:hypothetical protein ACHHYP_05921 [Achlya hypogyna]